MDICSGVSVEYNGKIYDENNLMGSDTLFGASMGGCDSIIEVNLTLITGVVFNYVETTCDQTFETIINGTSYNITNTTGQESIDGGATNGCDSIVNINITYLELVMGMLDSAICQGESVIVNGTEYNNTNPTGQETIGAGATNGCDSIVNISITFLPVSSSVEERQICPGESIVVNGTTYDQDLLFGEETLLAGSINGCDSTVTVIIELLAIPEGDMMLSSCDPEFSIDINGTTYNADNLSGIEILQAAASNGCDSMLNIQLSFEGLTATHTIIPPQCPESTMGQIEIISLSGSAPFYYIDGSIAIEIDALPYIVEVNVGSGILEFEDADGCQTSVNYNLITPTAPTLTYTVSGPQIDIQGVADITIDNVIWTPAEGLSCADCLDPTVSISEDMEYLVTIMYNDGCIASLAVPVDVEEPKIIIDYILPNIFSPNGDGNNDIFYLINSKEQDVLIQSMLIYDRWGNLVYQRENFLASMDIGWDGSFKGKELNPGVFIYMIQVIEDEKIVTLVGDVTIIK